MTLLTKFSTICKFALTDKLNEQRDVLGPTLAYSSSLSVHSAINLCDPFSYPLNVYRRFGKDFLASWNLLFQCIWLSLETTYLSNSFATASLLEADFMVIISHYYAILDIANLSSVETIHCCKVNQSIQWICLNLNNSLFFLHTACSSCLVYI